MPAHAVTASGHVGPLMQHASNKTVALLSPSVCIRKSPDATDRHDLEDTGPGNAFSEKAFT